MEPRILTLLLTLYKTQLENAIAQVRVDLPDNLKHPGQSLLGHAGEVCPVLDPLYELLGNLESNISLLKGEF